MSNRREFLQMSLAASALPVLAVQLEGAPPSRDRAAEQVQIDKVIVEMTSPLALAFGNEAIRLGLQPHGITDDITDLWYKNLAPQWKQAPGVLAGVTLTTSLFCLELLAHDHGMRLWLKAIHNYLPNGDVEHQLRGSDPIVQQASAFGDGWAPAFARLAAAPTILNSRECQKRIVESLGTRAWESGPMVSWIIGPRLTNRPNQIS